MFARFRQSGRRLQVSLVETRRLDAKVRHEHVASLGSIAVPPSVADRVAFWNQLHQRLAKLSNRIDSETQGKILGAVHGRIAMPMIGEIRALQLENAEADERFWSTLEGMHESTVADYVALKTTVERAITENQAGATKARESASAAKDRIERLKKGETVAGGLGKSMTFDEVIAAIGLTRTQARHLMRIHELSKIPGAFEEFLEKTALKDRTRAERAVALAILRRYGPRLAG